MGDFFQGLTNIPSESLRLITLMAGMVALNGLIGMASFLNERIKLSLARTEEWIKQSPEKSLLDELEHTKFDIEERVESTKNANEKNRERALNSTQNLDVASEFAPRVKNHADNFGHIKNILDEALKSKEENEKRKKQNSSIAKKTKQTGGPLKNRSARKNRR